MKVFHRWIAVAALLCLGAGFVPPVTAADANGEPLPKHARLRLGTLSFRQGSTVRGMTFLADGKTLVSAGDDLMLRFWEAGTGRELRHFQAPAAGTLAPDGQTFAAVEDNAKGEPFLRLWDTVSGKPGVTLAQVAAGAVFTALTFSPEGKTLAAIHQDGAGQNQILRVWNAGTGKELPPFRAPEPKEDERPFQPMSCQFSPDGKLLIAAGSDHESAGRAHRWEMATGKRLPDLDDSADDKRVQIDFHNATGPQGLATPPGLLVCSPNGKTLAALVSLDKDGTQEFLVRIWNLASGSRIRDLGPFDVARAGLCFAPNGKMLAVLSSDRQTVQLFDVPSGKELPEAKADGAIGALAFSPDGQLLALAGDAAVHLWDVAAGKAGYSLKGFSAGGAGEFFSESGLDLMPPLAFAPDGQTLYATGSALIRRWTVATGEEIRSGAGHEGPVLAVLLSPDGKRVVTVGGDNTARLWDTARGAEVRTFPGPEANPDEAAAGTTPAAAALSPDGATLAVGWPTGAIQLFDVASGKLLRALTGHPNFGVGSLSFAPDGTALTSASLDGRAFWWDVATGKMLRQLAGPPPGDEADEAGGQSSSLGVALSPDGRILAVASADEQAYTLQLLETLTGKQRRSFRVRPDKLSSVSSVLKARGSSDDISRLLIAAVVFAPDGRTIAWTVGDSIRFWDVARGRELRRFGVANGAPLGVVFSPDGKYLVATCGEGSVYVWETATGTVLGELTGHRGSVISAAFASRGRDLTLASAGADTTVLLWDLPAFLTAERVAPGVLTALQVKDLWQRLAGEDGEAAFDAQLQLAASPVQALPWLREHTKPAAAPDAKLLARLVEQLEDNRFGVRKKATAELEKLAELAAPALHKRLGEQPPLEVTQRIEQLLQKINGLVTQPERLQELRAVEVLEQIGTAEAQQVLSGLAKGAPAARQTQEAKAALERLR